MKPQNVCVFCAFRYEWNETREKKYTLTWAEPPQFSVCYMHITNNTRTQNSLSHSLFFNIFLFSLLLLFIFAFTILCGVCMVFQAQNNIINNNNNNNSENILKKNFALVRMLRSFSYHIKCSNLWFRSVMCQLGYFIYETKFNMKY